MSYKSLVRKYGVVEAAKRWKAEKKAKKTGKAKPKKAAKKPAKRGTVRTFVARGKTVTIVTGGRKAAKKSAKKPAKKRPSKRQAAYRALVKKYGVKQASAMLREGKLGMYAPKREPVTFKEYVKMYGVKQGAKFYRDREKPAYQFIPESESYGEVTSPAGPDGAYGTTQWKKEEEWLPYSLRPKAGSMRGRRRRRPGRMSGFLAPC